MNNKNMGVLLIIAVALGLFAFSSVSIFVNGFKMYKIYPLLLGFVNLVAVYYLYKKK